MVEYAIRTEHLSCHFGANRGSGPMWDDPEYQSFNALKEIRRMEVPVILSTGLWITTRLPRSCNNISTCWKHLLANNLLFSNHLHTPFMGEAEKFNQALSRIKRETDHKN